MQGKLTSCLKLIYSPLKVSVAINYAIVLEGHWGCHEVGPGSTEGTSLRV